MFNNVALNTEFLYRVRAKESLFSFCQRCKGMLKTYMRGSNLPHQRDSLSLGGGVILETAWHNKKV